MNIQDEIRAELRKIHSLLLTSGSFRSEDSEDCPDQDRTASGAGNELTAVESVWRRVSIAALQRAFPGRARSSAPASETKMTAVESMWRRVSIAALKRAISGRAGSSAPVSEAKITACAAPEAGRNSNGDMSESLAGKAALHLEPFTADGPDPGRVTSQSCTADAANMLTGKHGCNVSESGKEDNLAVIEEGGSCVQSTVDIGCRCSSVFTSFNIPPCNSEIKPTDNWPEGPAVQMPPSQDTLDGQGRSTADPTIARKEDMVQLWRLWLWHHKHSLQMFRKRGLLLRCLMYLSRKFSGLPHHSPLLNHHKYLRHYHLRIHHYFSQQLN